MAKLLLTPEEAAEMLSLGRTKVYQLMAEGMLRSVRIGKCRRVPTSTLVELIDFLAADTTTREPTTAVSPSS